MYGAILRKISGDIGHVPTSQPNNDSKNKNQNHSTEKK